MKRRVPGVLLSICLLLSLLPAGALTVAFPREAAGRGGAAVRLSGAGGSFPEQPEAVYGIAGDSAPLDGAAEAVYGIDRDSAVYDSTAEAVYGIAGDSAPLDGAAEAVYGIDQNSAGPEVGCTRTEGCSLPKDHEGDCVPHEARYQTEADGEWSYGTLANACANVYSGGGVVVQRDIELEEGVPIIKPMTITSVDPKNPCTITYSPKDRGDYLLTITGNGSVKMAYLTLDGGSEKGAVSQAELVMVKGNLPNPPGNPPNTLIMGPKAVIQNNYNVDTIVADSGGGLRIIGGQVKMESGSLIRNCRGRAGGGVVLKGNNGPQYMSYPLCYRLIIAGGVIEDCQALRGGGIYVAESGTMWFPPNCNTCIRRNRAVMDPDNPSSVISGCGGGIHVDVGYIQIFAGSIEDNYAENSGGGIYIEAGNYSQPGGAVTGNHAEKYGGGIFESPLDPGTLIQLGNSPTVKDNTSGYPYFDNLYLDNNEEEPEDVTHPIDIAAALWPGASIGISRWLRPDAENSYRVVAQPHVNSSGVRTYTITEDDLAKFHSDDPKYVTLLLNDTEDPTNPDNGKIVITTADVVFDREGHGPTVPGQRLEGDHKVAKPDEQEMKETGAEEGYDFQGWYEDETFVTPWDFDNRTVDETDGQARPLQILHAKWVPIEYPITYDLHANEGDTVENNNPVTYNIEDDDITLEDPVRVGYRFIRWKEVTEETRISLFSSRRRSVDGAPDIPHGSKGPRKFEAQWEEAAPCTVTYMDGVGGAAFADQKYSNCAFLSKTPAFVGTPTRSGCDFTGWEPEVAEIVTADAEYTAQWEENAVPKPPDPPGGGGGGGGDSDSGDPPAKPDPDPGEEPPQDPGAELPPGPGTEPAPGPGEELPSDPGTDPGSQPEPAPKPKPDHIPQTGDPTHTALWAGCALASLAGIVLALRPQRRRR